MTEASRQLNIPVPTILWRLNSKNPKFDGYKYINEEISMLSSQPLSHHEIDNYEPQNLQLDNH
jgi:hypothetical protein